MQFKGKETSDMELSELQAAISELEEVAASYLEKLKHPKFEKLKPKPELSPSFKALQNEIQKEIEKRK